MGSRRSGGRGNPSEVDQGSEPLAVEFMIPQEWRNDVIRYVLLLNLKAHKIVRIPKAFFIQSHVWAEIPMFVESRFSHMETRSIRQIPRDPTRCSTDNDRRRCSQSVGQESQRGGNCSPNIRVKVTDVILRASETKNQADTRRLHTSFLILVSLFSHISTNFASG